jgi:ATP-binding cassette subfamily B protein
MEQNISQQDKPKPKLFGLFKPYKGLVAALVVLAVFSNGLSLLVPKIIA